MLKFITTCCCTLICISVFSQYSYTSPINGSEYHSTETSILLRPANGFDREAIVANEISVVGTVSGVHSTSMKFATDGRTIIIDPDEPFVRGEEVTVNIAEGGLPALVLQFAVSSKQVAHKEEQPVQSPYRLKGGGAPANFPAVNITNINPAPGKIFFRNREFAIPSDRFYAIVNNAWDPEFWVQSNGKGQGLNINHNGYLTYYDLPNKQFMVMDSSYMVIDSFACLNGYTSTGHEFQIFPNGDAFIQAYDPQPVDMSQVVAGGDPNAIVTGLIVQQIDANKNLVFQWRSWDHFQITDAVGIDLTAATVDYSHGNAIELDNDGNIMISSRHMNEITKIDLNTGNIIWRFGGANNEFILVGDTMWFNRQHDIRRIANGNVTLFDNGNLHVPSRSFVREYTLDEINKVATQVWSYEHPQGVYGQAMGNAQRLPNGNTWINWGWPQAGEPNMTEVDANGNIIFEVDFLVDDNRIYRSFRHEWNPVSVGIHETRATNLIQLYPNPASGQVTVHLNLNESVAGTLTLIDPKGSIVWEQTREWQQGGHQVQLPNALTKGLYLVQLTTDKERWSKKLMVR